MDVRNDDLRFVDTHAHLDDRAFDQDRGSVVEQARSAGVAAMINVGYAPARWDSTVALASAHPDIAFTLGLHPGHADEFSDDLMADLERRVLGQRPCAVGEIGLDYSRSVPDRRLQRRVFEAQLELARVSGLPVVIHQREAAADCAASLSRTAADRSVILHSFDGSEALLTLGLDRGWVFGVGGLMTRASSQALRDALRKIPCNQLVLETDAPYLVPAGTKERRNRPALIPLIAERLADHLNLPLSEVAHSTTVSAARVFALELDADG
ncbi:MAG TPA: TatD family hydrolase [Thermomicrobiales bacterium]|nr:TatD family hydrolase [Thermomicrobiales bacterium]